jgi:hypothetical protein
MSTDIISGATTDLLTVDPTSKAARVTQYDTTGAVVSPATAAGLTAGTAKIQPYDVGFNQTALITPLRHQAQGSITRIYGDSFADGIGAGEEDAGAFPSTVTVTGTATGTAASGGLTFRTNATIPSTWSFFSTSVLPYLTGSTSHHQGAYTFQSANLTAFRVISRRNSVDTPVDSTAFSVTPATVSNPGTAGALCTTNTGGVNLVDGLSHRLEIFYQGNGAFFSIDGVVVHRMSAQIAAPRTNTLDLTTGYEGISAAGPICTVRVGQYTATDGYFFECLYNVADVTAFARGLSANRIGPVPRLYRTADGYDSSKVKVVIKFEAVAPGTADTLLSLVKQTAGVDAGGATSIAVAANKVLRITGFSLSLKNNAAAVASCTLTLRWNPSGATVIGSPSWGRFDLGLTTAVALDSKNFVFNFPEQQEFSGANTLGASLLSSAVTNIMSLELYGYEVPIQN